MSLFPVLLLYGAEIITDMLLMFLAPGLYVIYALLYGIFTMITVALGFRAGFSFSAGAMDLLFSSSLPAAQKTWLILPLGIAAFIVFYVVYLILTDTFKKRKMLFR